MTVILAPPLPIVKERFAKFTTTNKKNKSRFIVLNSYGYSNLFFTSKKTHGICHRYLKLTSEFCNRNIIRASLYGKFIDRYLRH